jgi:hypothetical protein
MAPKHQQKAKSGGTDSTKTSEKEELVQARAVKRAERAEVRRVQAEERKEAVCLHYSFVPPTQSGVLPPNGNFRETLTSVPVIITKPLKSTMLLLKPMVLMPHTCQTWPQHG